jgi:hypothetical protein
MYVCHSDRSAASAIFADGTYFVDMPRRKTEINIGQKWIL